MSEEFIAIRESAFEDLAVYDAEQFRGAEKQALDCEDQLLQLWLTSAQGRGDGMWALFYPQVEAKFARRGAVPDSSAQSASVAEAALARLNEVRLGGATPPPRGDGGCGEVP